MEALILDGLGNKNEMISKIKPVVQEQLRARGYRDEWIDLTATDIKYCLGCSYCSSRQPGICVINDDLQAIFPQMANCDFLIFLCGISFGGYNSQLKKVVDRYSVLGLPTYTIHHGELHHPLRYSKPNLFMSIGVDKAKSIQQSETFELVSERTAISCFIEKAATVVLDNSLDEDEIYEKLQQGFIKVGD